MTEIITLLTICIFTAIGYLIINKFSLLSGNTNLLVIPLSFALGAGVISLQLYAYEKIHIPWNIVYILLPWIILACLAYSKAKKKRISFRFPKLSLQKIDYILLILISLLVLFVAFESVLRPVIAWDAWAIWLFKSKIFFIDGGINAEIFSYVASSYPVLVSLMYTSIYVFIGHVDDRSALLLSTAFYASLGIGFYGYLRDKTGITYALFGTFLLLSTQNILRHGGRLEAGQADIILSLYLMLTGIVFVEFLKKNNIKTLFLIQLLLGITALIKNEGLLFSIFIQLYLWFSFLRNKRYSYFLYSFIWLIPVLDWEYYKYSNNLPKLSEVFIGGSTNFSKIVTIVLACGKEFVNIKNWNLLWVLFFTVIALQNTKLLKSIYLPLYIMLTLMAGLYFFLYMVFPGDPVALAESSFNRLLLQLAPSALLVSLLEIYPLIESNRYYRRFILKKN